MVEPAAANLIIAQVVEVNQQADDLDSVPNLVCID